MYRHQGWQYIQNHQIPLLPIHLIVKWAYFHANIHAVPKSWSTCQEATLREIHGFPSFCHIEMYLVPRCLYPCVDHENKSVERRQSAING